MMGTESLVVLSIFALLMLAIVLYDAKDKQKHRDKHS
jgi:hypothetical protein